MTLNDLERRNGRYFVLFRPNVKLTEVGPSICDKNVAQRLVFGII